MPNHLLDQIRRRVEILQYVMTLHAEEEMEDDGLTIFDVEHVILTGEIIEHQVDADTDEGKYLIEGSIESGAIAVVVVKLGPTGTVVIITVYLV